MKTIKNNEAFIIQHDPTATLGEMFQGFWEAVDTGKPNIQPKNLMVVDSIETAYKIMTEPRLEIFYVISEKQPRNIQQLAELLNKDTANVWRDCQVLANIGVIKLKKEGKEVRPIALYKRIVLDFPNKEIFSQKTSTITLPISH